MSQKKIKYHHSSQKEEIKEIIFHNSSPTDSHVKEINISNTNSVQSKQGVCQGCGILGSNLRNTTNEHLCSECRNDINFKLITKTTALKKYPNITYQDLINNYKSKKIHCFFVKNWVDPSKDCIKLYYEKEIQKLNQNIKHKNISKSKSRPKSKPKSKSR